MVQRSTASLNERGDKKETQTENGQSKSPVGGKPPRPAPGVRIVGTVSKNIHPLAAQ